MEIVNLIADISEGRFLRDEILPYDLIMWERMPGELPKGTYTHMSINDIHYDFGVAGQMSAMTEKYDRILLIIDTLNVLYLLPWISQLSEKKNVTIVTLSSGVASYMRKSQPEMSDVALVMPYMKVCEVYDKETLNATLIAGGKRYVRVPHGETHESLFPKALTSDKGISDVRGQ